MRNVLLVLGGISIVFAGIYTLVHLADGVVFSVLVPGFVIGLLLIGLSTQLKRSGPRRLD